MSFANFDTSPESSASDVLDSSDWITHCDNSYTDSGIHSSDLEFQGHLPSHLITNALTDVHFNTPDNTNNSQVHHQSINNYSNGMLFPRTRYLPSATTADYDLSAALDVSFSDQNYVNTDAMPQFSNVSAIKPFEMEQQRLLQMRRDYQKMLLDVEKQIIENKLSLIDQATKQDDMLFYSNHNQFLNSSPPFNNTLPDQSTPPYHSASSFLIMPNLPQEPIQPIVSHPLNPDNFQKTDQNYICDSSISSHKTDKLLNSKRKSNNASKRTSNQRVQPYLNLVSSSASTFSETLVSGDTASQNSSKNFETGTRKRQSHNAIEERYRKRINSKIQELRGIVAPNESLPKSNILARTVIYVKQLEEKNRSLEIELFNLKGKATKSKDFGNEQNNIPELDKTSLQECKVSPREQLELRHVPQERLDKGDNCETELTMPNNVKIIHDEYLSSANNKSISSSYSSMLATGRELFCLFVCLLCFIFPDPINIGAIPSSFSSQDAYGGLGKAVFRSRTLLYENNKDQDELLQQSYLYDYCSIFVGYVLRIVGFVLSFCFYLYFKKKTLLYINQDNIVEFRKKLMCAKIAYQDEKYDKSLSFLNQALYSINSNFYNSGTCLIFSLFFSLLEAIILNSRLWQFFTKIPFLNRSSNLSLENRKIVTEIYDCHHLIYLIVYLSNKKISALNAELHAFSHLSLFQESAFNAIFMQSHFALYILFMGLLPKYLVNSYLFKLNTSQITAYSPDQVDCLLTNPSSDNIDEVYQHKMFKASKLKLYFKYSSIWSVSFADDLNSSIHSRLFCFEYFEGLDNFLSSSHTQESLNALLSKFLYICNKYKYVQLSMSTSECHIEDQYIKWWSNVAIYAVLSKMYNQHKDNNSRIVLSLPNSLFKTNVFLPKSIALAYKFHSESLSIQPRNFQYLLFLSLNARNCLSSSVAQDTPNSIERNLYTLLQYLACEWLLSGLERIYSKTLLQDEICTLFEAYLHAMDILDEVVSRRTRLNEQAKQHYLFIENISC